MLPGLDGITVCRAIRRDSPNGDVPILMLTARREESDKVLGLESGADDYLTKPFGIREFVARVRALLRRRWTRPSGAPGHSAAVTAGDLVVDPARRHARLGDREIDLTAHEFELLYLLASNRGIVFSREALMGRVWGDDTHITERSVDTLVKRVRRKIEIDPAEPRYILTVWGTGTSSPMSNPVWYRSLYWRIAFGFIAMLAVLLLAQGLLFLWLTDRFVGSSARTPAQLSEQVADVVSAQLARHPDLDLKAYLPDRFRQVYQPFVVVLADGRHAVSRPAMLPPGFERAVVERTRRTLGSPDGFGRRGGPRTQAEYAPIVVNGSQVGIVGVPSAPPPVFLALRELGPTLTWFGAALLGIGATLTALFIFRPAHNRLRNLEQAAHALGEGRTDVRANERGGDEVSALARTFNRMAVDLDSRAQALAASDRTRRQLLADVSHELMTPLSAIRGYVETLGMPEVPLDEPTRRRYLGIVEQETHKLEAIIGDLLDLARLEGGGETLRAEPVQVSDLFNRVNDRHERALKDRNITLDVQVSPATPPAWGDAARLEQALQNLAANAIRHTPAGGRITLGAEPDGDGVRIQVRDTGPGIPPEHLARVFDRFYKVDAARSGTAGPSGSGLGLSIVQAIVTRHGGRVSATNLPDGGALFELVLPPRPQEPGGRIAHRIDRVITVARRRFLNEAAPSAVCAVS